MEIILSCRSLVHKSVLMFFLCVWCHFRVSAVTALHNFLSFETLHAFLISLPLPILPSIHASLGRLLIVSLAFNVLWMPNLINDKRKKMLWCSKIISKKYLTHKLNYCLPLSAYYHLASTSAKIFAGVSLNWRHFPSYILYFQIKLKILTHFDEIFTLQN